MVDGTLLAAAWAFSYGLTGSMTSIDSSIDSEPWCLEFIDYLSVLMLFDKASPW
jgi:hypothetical protein